MKRRDFLKRFGIGAAAAVAAPSLVRAALPEPTGELMTPEEYHLDKCRGVYKHSTRFQYPMTPDECYTSAFDDAHLRHWEGKHWPELYRRYGNIDIFESMKATKP